MLLGTWEKTIRIVTITSLMLMTCWGLAQVLTIMKPFWVDEWRLIYNLKFKNSASLWGPLDFTQQFPRVYLQVIKAITSKLNYSYFSLRLPSFLIGTVTMLLSYKVMGKIYSRDSVTKFLFVFLIISSVPFMDYFVQMKQYTMEIFLSLFAVWQMVEIIRIGTGLFPGKLRYATLCFSFFAAPFFSYTYPIAVAPVFVVAAFQTFSVLNGTGSAKQRSQIMLQQWAPLILSAIGIILFYIIDVSKLMVDPEMHGYWSYRMITGGSGFISITGKLWDFFAQKGSGLIFEIILGTLGVCAFLRTCYWWLSNLKKEVYEPIDLLRLYSILLILLALALFFAGKIPIEPKFNVFTTPAIAILIIGLMDALLANPLSRKSAGVILTIIYIELAGNLATTASGQITAPEYAKRIKIYTTTEKAISYAQRNNLPIFITADVAYPDAITDHVANLTPIPAASVLKGFPAYSSLQNIPVYTIQDTADIQTEMKRLPSSVTAVLAGDGLSYRVVKKEN